MRLNYLDPAVFLRSNIQPFASLWQFKTVPSIVIFSLSWPERLKVLKDWNLFCTISVPLQHWGQCWVRVITVQTLQIWTERMEILPQPSLEGQVEVRPGRVLKKEWYFIQIEVLIKNWGMKSQDVFGRTHKNFSITREQISPEAEERFVCGECVREAVGTHPDWFKTECIF